MKVLTERVACFVCFDQYPAGGGRAAERELGRRGGRFCEQAGRGPYLPALLWSAPHEGVGELGQAVARFVQSYTPSG